VQTWFYCCMLSVVLVGDGERSRLTFHDLPSGCRAVLESTDGNTLYSPQDRNALGRIEAVCGMSPSEHWLPLISLG